MKLPLLALLCAILAGCASGLNTRLRWSDEMLIGLSMELDDPVAMESYTFLKDGIGVARLGIKNGAFTCPGISWKIDDDRLVILSGPDLPQPQFRLIRADARSIMVEERDGTKLVFRITEMPNKAPEPTTTSGTSAAEQPRVPAAVVAHL